jgi:hypothetical protein
MHPFEVTSMTFASQVDHISLILIERDDITVPTTLIITLEHATREPY